MGFYSTTIESEKSHQKTSDCGQKTASGNFFRYPLKTQYENQHNSLKTSQKNHTSARKTALGVHFKNYLDHVYAVSDDRGDIKEHYRYTAFGEVTIYNENGTQIATTAIDNHILWNTRRKDAVSGYYMYKFRHYSAELGRWPSRDPIGERGGLNLYAFVGNDGINNWDKLGLHQLKKDVKQGLWSGTKFNIQFDCDENPNIVDEQPYGTQDTGLVVGGSKSEASATVDNVKKHKTKEKCDGGCYIYYTFDFNYEVWETVRIGAEVFGIDFETEFRYQRDDFSGSEKVTTKKICCKN